MSDKRKSTRRRSRRVIDPLSIPVFWKGKSGRHTAYMCNVGMGGCFLNTAGEADVSEHITVEIPKPAKGEQVVKFEATVIPQERKLKGFGLRFAPLSKEQQSVITFFMLQSTEASDRRR